MHRIGDVDERRGIRPAERFAVEVDAQDPVQPADTRTADATSSQSSASYDRPYGLGGPAQPANPPDDKQTKSLTDPKQQAPAQPQTAKAGDKAQQRRPASSGYNLPPLPGTYKPNEVLVPGLRDEVGKELVNRNYTVEKSKVAGLARVVLPEGSMLSPKYPAAVVAGNVEVSQAVTDTLFSALGALGSAQGTMNNLTFGDDAYQYYETICSGAPAGEGFNGASAVHTFAQTPQSPGDD